MASLKFNKNAVPLYVISLIPLWWILGFGFFIFHLSSIYIAAILKRNILPRDSVQLGILALVAVLSVSLLYNSVVDDAGLSRIFGAFHNITVLLVGYFHYSYLRYLLVRDEAWALQVSKQFSRVSLAAIVIAGPLAVLVFTGSASSLGVPTLLGAVTPPAENLLGLYQKADLIARNWFDGSDAPRLMALSTNATASAALIAVSGFMGAGYILSRRPSGFWVFLGLTLFVVAATLTRATTLTTIAGVAVIMLARTRSRYYPIFLAAAPLVLIAAIYFIPEFLGRVNEMREGSSNARFLAYEYAYQLTMEQNPLIGVGVKPRIDELAIPVGSHSTIFSALVRGGVLGALIAILTFFAIPFISGLRIIRALVGNRAIFGEGLPYAVAALGGVPSVLAYCVLQDLDVYAPITAAFFMYLASLKYWADRTRGAT